MEPEKLKEPLTSVHHENIPNDAGSFFRRKLIWKKLGHFQNSELPFQVNLFSKHPIKLLAGLPHAVGESLVKPCALEMVQLVC
jgi:hypothetical protein